LSAASVEHCRNHKDGWDSPVAHNIADLLARVTVSHTSLKISVKRDRLLAILTDKFVEQSRDNDKDNIISLEVPIPAMADGGSGKFVLEDQNAKTPNAVVVKAIARASVWFEQLSAGKSQSMAQIAAREDITDNYVSNLIHLAWLSPDLVGRVLEGGVRLGHGNGSTRCRLFSRPS
jgi:hypothetical protein